MILFQRSLSHNSFISEPEFFTIYFLHAVWQIKGESVTLDTKFNVISKIKKCLGKMRVFCLILLFFLLLFFGGFCSYLSTHKKKQSVPELPNNSYNNFSFMHETFCEQNVLNHPLFRIILTFLYQMLFFWRVTVNNMSIGCVVTDSVAYFTRGKMHVVFCPNYSNNYVPFHSIFLYNDLQKYNNRAGSVKGLNPAVISKVGWVWSSRWT